MDDVIIALAEKYKYLDLCIKRELLDFVSFNLVVCIALHVISDLIMIQNGIILIKIHQSTITKILKSFSLNANARLYNAFIKTWGYLNLNHRPHH